MAVPLEASDVSITPSLNQSITRSNNTGYTYSTSAMESDMKSSGSLTLNTLSMISTPWVTESFDVKTDTEATNISDISSLMWTGTPISSTTVPPRSSSSYGVTSPPLHTDCDTTMTILAGVTITTTSTSLRPLPSAQNTSGTLSSWTLEYFTSSGFTDEDSNVVRAKYPWSPDTVLSGTDLDLYPSTESFPARKGSRATITPATSNSRREERDHITPLHYIGLNSKPGAKPYLHWTLGKLKGVTMSDSLNAAITV